MLQTYEVAIQGEEELNDEFGNSQLCVRHEVVSPDGTYRLWVAKDSGLLRRIAFPPATEVPPGVERIELVADIDQVRTQVDAAELVAVHKDADTGNLQEVRHFVLPPLPPATKLLGQQIGPLQFERRGGSIVVSSKERQITVATWFHNHPASRIVVEQLESLRRRIRSERVQFINVYLHDGRDGSTAAIADWQLSDAPVLDTRAQGLKYLGVEQAPTTVVLGEDNTLHHFEVGANPNVGNNVAVVVERLLAGHDVAKDTLSQMQHLKSSYQQQLARAKAGDGWVEEVEVRVPERTEPKQLKLNPLWQNKDVSEPGNFLVIPGKQKTLLVVDGWNQLVSLRADGTLAQRISLELPSDAGVTLLRAGKGKRDRGIIAAATRGGRPSVPF